MIDREFEIMGDLLCHERSAVQHGFRAAARPMDVGGSNGSHHGATLMRMVHKGWVRNVGTQYRVTKGSRRRFLYCSTEEGRAEYRAEAIKRHQGENAERFHTNLEALINAAASAP